MYDGLDRYRRSFIWARGRYILLLDDIRASHHVNLTWLVQGPQIETVDAQLGTYRLRKGEARLDFQVAAAFDSAAIADSTADSKGESLGYKQLQLRRLAARWWLASLFDPWHRGLKVAVKPAGENQATVTVSGPDFTDTWRWTAAPDGSTPSALTAEGTNGFAAALGPDDKAPASGGAPHQIGS